MDIYAQKNFMCLCVRTASHTQTVYVLLRIFNDQSMYGHNKTVANGFSHCVAYVLCDEIQVSSDSTSIPCLSDRSSVRVCVSENGKHVQFCSIQATTKTTKPKCHALR